MTYEKLYDMLEHDHEEVKNMFETALKNDDPSKFSQLKKELELHMKLEEDYYYPKARKVDEDLVEHGIEEHEEAREVIKELDKLKQNDDKFMPKLKELKESVEHHVKEEETELFPKTKKNLDDKDEKEAASKIEKEKSKNK